MRISENLLRISENLLRISDDLPTLSRHWPTLSGRSGVGGRRSRPRACWSAWASGRV